MDTNPEFEQIAQKMASAGLSETAIKNFEYHFNSLETGESGTLSASGFSDVGRLPDAAQLGSVEPIQAPELGKVAVIKLNGGLGTSMGLAKAKSLLPVKNGLTFLDISVQQTLAIRESLNSRVPLIFMNSFQTRDDTLAVLDRYADLNQDLPVDFMQNRVPRIRVDDRRPFECASDPSAEWCPPGHGDIYSSMWMSGIFAALLSRGFVYAFISNSDNLGASLDPHILYWFAGKQAPFLMEVTDRTRIDTKGGHLARLRNGRLTLREIAQCPPDELDDFQDIERHRYFNTNNLWVNLAAFDDLLARNGGLMKLPTIRNVKTLRGSDHVATKVYQLETAMGSAIGLFEGALALCVPRSRFIPVKTTDDLLRVRSDLYELTEKFAVVPAPKRPSGQVAVHLDREWFTTMEQFDARFPDGPPSLIRCLSLTVRGNVYFGKGVVVEGDVEVSQTSAEPRWIEEGTVLTG